MRSPVNYIAALSALVLLAGCGGSGPKAGPPPATVANGPAADYPMVLGQPYAVEGVTWTPADRLNYDDVGYAAPGADGAGVSAAHKTLPLPSYVEVTSLETGRTILVRVERRGPMRNDRLVELSPAAFAQLGGSGERVPVRVRRVNPPEPERALLRAGQKAPERMDTPKPLLGVLMRKLEPAAPPVAVPSAVPSPVAEARPGPRAQPSPRATAKPRPNPAPVATPAPVAAPAAVATPAAQPASRSPVARGSGAGRLVVQLGAFSSRERADAAAAKAGGSVSQAGRFWRVRTGPFASQAEADAALAKARASGYSDARVQRAD